MRYIALVLRIDFKFDLDKTQVDIRRIGRAIKRPFSTAMHTKGGVSFIVVTQENSAGLLARLRPELDDIHAVSNYWAEMAPIDLEGRHGSFDPFVTRVKDAWRDVRQRNEAEHMRDRKGRKV